MNDIHDLLLDAREIILRPDNPALNESCLMWTSWIVGPGQDT